MTVTPIPGDPAYSSGLHRLPSHIFILIKVLINIIDYNIIIIYNINLI